VKVRHLRARAAVRRAAAPYHAVGGGGRAPARFTGGKWNSPAVLSPAVPRWTATGVRMIRGACYGTTAGAQTVSEAGDAARPPGGPALGQITGRRPPSGVILSPITRV
jgi:hypothetical protein